MHKKLQNRANKSLFHLIDGILGTLIKPSIKILHIYILRNIFLFGVRIMKKLKYEELLKEYSSLQTKYTDAKTVIAKLKEELDEKEEFSTVELSMLLTLIEYKFERGIPFDEVNLYLRIYNKILKMKAENDFDIVKDVKLMVDELQSSDDENKTEEI